MVRGQPERMNKEEGADQKPMQLGEPRAVRTDKRTQPGTDFASNFMEKSVY